MREVWRKSAGNRGLERGGRVPESEGWGMEEECEKYGGRVPESEAWVWRKMPESEAWSIESGGKRGLEHGGRCRKAVSKYTTSVDIQKTRY